MKKVTVSFYIKDTRPCIKMIAKIAATLGLSIGAQPREFKESVELESTVPIYESRKKR